MKTALSNLQLERIPVEKGQAVLALNFQLIAWFSRVAAAINEFEAEHTPIVFDDLPASPTEGMRRPITNSATAVWGAAIVATGANHVLGYFDGTNWTVAAK